MVNKRLIPCLLFDGKYLVKTINFKNPKYIGDPINAIKIFNDKEVDELILLDITATKERRSPDINKLSQFASECFMPFAYGGGVKTFEDFQRLFNAGIEKVIVNSLIFNDPNLIKRAVSVFGSQAIVASIDVKKSILGQYNIFSHMGYKTKMNLDQLIMYVQNDLKVGELIITAVHREGTWEEFDYSLYNKIHSEVKVPLIASGGASSSADIEKILYEVNVDAAAIGSMAIYPKKGMGVLINFPKRKTIIKD